MLSSIDYAFFDSLINRVSKEQIEVDITVEPDRTEIDVRPWKPYEPEPSCPNCPYKEK